MTNSVRFGDIDPSDRTPIGTYNFIMQDHKKGVRLTVFLENSGHPERIVHLGNKYAEGLGLDPKFTSGAARGPEGFVLQWFKEGIPMSEIKRQVRRAARGF